MTENPKSCKFRVFQSENNYSPHHEHVLIRQIEYCERHNVKNIN